MDRIRIRGGAPLHGQIPISGAKNAALPLMIASLLTEDTLELVNVPRLADISSLLRILSNFEVDRGYVVARAPRGLKGAEFTFPKVTVGGTHVALMAATLADGTTVIENAAREPEVVDLANCLIKMGARIEGAGSPRIVIDGVARLHGATHEVLPDRIETGTYAMAVAMTGGDVVLGNTRPDLLQFALDVLGQTGAEVSATNQGILVRRNGSGIEAVDVTT